MVPKLCRPAPVSTRQARVHLSMHRSWATVEASDAAVSFGAVKIKRVNVSYDTVEDALMQ
ncbi:hypothetical protein GCM10018954_005650 [Kutzneria kofuensis]